MAEIYYQWKVPGTVEGEDKPRLLTPWADPFLYEFAFDFMFDTPELALEGLDDWEAREHAEVDWVLVKVTVEPLENQPFNPQST